MNVKEAKSIAFGSQPGIDLAEYYSAWQWLYDNDIILRDGDIAYLDKLICDGVVEPKPDYYNE